MVARAWSMVTAVTWLVLPGCCGPSSSRATSGRLLEQLGDYLQRAFLHFDLGNSWENNRPPVAGMLREGLPADLWLLAGGLAFGLAAGIAAGAYVGVAAARAAGAGDRGGLDGLPVRARLRGRAVAAAAVRRRASRSSGIGFIPLKYVPFEESPVALARLADRPVDRRSGCRWRPSASG